MITTAEEAAVSLGSPVDVSGLTGLEFLWCSDNGLTELRGLGSLQNLKTLYCGNTGLTKLEGLESLQNLKKLHCDNTNLTKLDVSNSSIETLDCENAPIINVKLPEGELTIGSSGNGTAQVVKYWATNIIGNRQGFMTINATAQKGYTFKEWRKSGTALWDITENPITYFRLKRL